MAPPTRGQIDASITSPTYTVEYWNGSAWTAISDDDVIAVAGGHAAGIGETGLAFGAFANPGGSIDLWDTSTIAAIAWARARVRVSYGFDTSDQLVRLIGLLTERERILSNQEAAFRFSVGGLDELIADTPIYSPMFYRRNAATATTAVSVEDPGSGSYVGGLINYILWQAGGRPYEQAGSYPSAIFYYSCEPSLITPEWSWIAGENAWEELNRLCKACAGQLFQDVDGVLRFVNPLSLAPASTYTFTVNELAGISERSTTIDLVGAARCSYVARRLQPRQIVYEDTTPRLIAPGETLSLVIEPTLPVYEWITPGSEAVNVTDIAINLVTVTPSLTSAAAGRATVSVTNGSSTAYILSRITIYGRPVAAVEEGQARYGSATPEIAIGDDAGVYVQSRSHAERLCRIAVDFYGSARAQRTLTACGYDPDRTIGEGVGLTVAAWSLSATAHRIIGIEHQDTGAWMDVTLVDVTGVPTASDLFQIGGSYSAGDTRTLGY